MVSNLRLVIATLIESATCIFMCLPLVLAFMMHVSGCCMHLTGVKGMTFVLLISLVRLSVLGLFEDAVLFLHSAAKDDVFAPVILGLLSAALFCLTCFVFRRPQGMQRRRRAGTNSETLEQLGEALSRHNHIV